MIVTKTKLQNIFTPYSLNINILNQLDENGLEAGLKVASEFGNENAKRYSQIIYAGMKNAED